MAEMNMQTLLHPPFESDPPVKLNIPAKWVGLVLAILGALGFLFGIFGLLLGGLAAAFGALSGNILAVLLPVAALIGLIADGLIAWGGYKMYQEDVEGKKYVIYGLVGYVLQSIVSVLSNALHPVSLIAGLFGLIIAVAIAAIVWYIVIISRFTNDAPLVASGGAPPPSVPPPSAPPPPAPPQ